MYSVPRENNRRYAPYRNSCTYNGTITSNPSHHTHIFFDHRSVKEKENTETMSGSTRLDVAALAASGVLTADELMKAVEANHKHCSDIQKHHLTHAAISAAVAVGAFELLRRDREKGGDVEDRRPVVVEEDGEDIVVRSEKHRHDRHYCHHNGQCDESYHSPHGHKRRLLEEIAGAYSLGEEMIGNQKHHVAHLVSCHRSEWKIVLECRLQPIACKALTLD